MKKILTICILGSVMVIGSGCADHDIHSKQTQAKLKAMTHQLSKPEHSSMYQICHPTHGKTCNDACEANIHNKNFYSVYKKGCLAMGFSSSDCGPSYASIGCPKFCAAACKFAVHGQQPSKK